MFAILLDILPYANTYIRYPRIPPVKLYIISSMSTMRTLIPLRYVTFSTSCKNSMDADIIRSSKTYLVNDILSPLADTCNANSGMSMQMFPAMFLTSSSATDYLRESRGCMFMLHTSYENICSGGSSTGKSVIAATKTAYMKNTKFRISLLLSMFLRCTNNFIIKYPTMQTIIMWSESILIFQCVPSSAIPS